jgi:hypothetical protein
VQAKLSVLPKMRGTLPKPGSIRRSPRAQLPDERVVIDNDIDPYVANKRESEDDDEDEPPPPRTQSVVAAMNSEPSSRSLAAMREMKSARPGWNEEKSVRQYVSADPGEAKQKPGPTPGDLEAAADKQYPMPVSPTDTPTVNDDMKTENVAAPPLEKRQLILIMIGLAVAILMAALDTTIVATALPAIVKDLNGTTDQYSWVVIACKRELESGRRVLVVCAMMILLCAKNRSFNIDGICALVRPTV